MLDPDPVATRRRRRADLRDTRRQTHKDRAERRRVKEATTSTVASAEGHATSKPANLCAGIYGEQAAALVNPGLSSDLARADDMDLGDPLLCPVCTEPLCRSVAISGCGHVFCEACLIKGALQAKVQACPLCRAPWVLASLARCTERDALVAAAMPEMARWRARKAAAGSAQLHASTLALERRLDATRSGLLLGVSDHDTQVGTDSDTDLDDDDTPSLPHNAA